MAWTTLDDFHKDIWEYSGVDINNQYQHAPPPTIIDFQNKMSANRGKSIFDNDEHSEGVTYFINGRGKGFKNIPLTPGTPIRTDVNCDDEIKKKIREVSGFGHSNEFIVQSLNIPKYTPSSASASHTSEEVAFEDVETSGPSPQPTSPVAPPLSQILKQGRLDLKKKSNPMKWDLESLEEFPAL